MTWLRCLDPPPVVCNLYSAVRRYKTKQTTCRSSAPVINALVLSSWCAVGVRRYKVVHRLQLLMHVMLSSGCAVLPLPFLLRCWQRHKHVALKQTLPFSDSYNGCYNPCFTNGIRTRLSWKLVSASKLRLRVT